MLWIDQEVQPFPFVCWLHHWLMLCPLGLVIVNVHWRRNSDRFLTIFILAMCTKMAMYSVPWFKSDLWLGTLTRALVYSGMWVECSVLHFLRNRFFQAKMILTNRTDTIYFSQTSNNKKILRIALFRTIQKINHHQIMKSKVVSKS